MSSDNDQDIRKATVLYKIMELTKCVALVIKVHTDTSSWSSNTPTVSPFVGDGDENVSGNTNDTDSDS